MATYPGYPAQSTKRVRFLVCIKSPTRHLSSFSSICSSLPISPRLPLLMRSITSMVSLPPALETQMLVNLQMLSAGSSGLIRRLSRCDLVHMVSSHPVRYTIRSRLCLRTHLQSDTARGYGRVRVCWNALHHPRSGRKCLGFSVLDGDPCGQPTAPCHSIFRQRCVHAFIDEAFLHRGDLHGKRSLFHRFCLWLGKSSSST